MSNEPDVAIIGAGFAGLAAAKRLAEAGLHVVILEATERVGGRAHTIHPYAGVPAEVGPEYVHGEPDVSLRLLRAAGLERERFSDRHHQRRDGQLVEQPAFWARFGKILRHAPSASRDMSARDFIVRERARGAVREDDAQMFAMLVEGFYAAPLADISIASVAADAEGMEAGEEQPPQTRLVAGYGPLAEWMRTRFERAGGVIHYRSVVRAIDWRELHTRIIYRHNSDDLHLRARRVICTLPLGVLTSGDVVIYPSLGVHARALRGLAMGHVVKLVACLNRPVWKERTPENLSFVHADRTAFPTFWLRSRGDAHQLTAWAGGPHAEALVALSGEELLGRALADFARTLDMPLSVFDGAIEHHHFHDYAGDPFARGAYSYTRAGGMGCAEQLTRPLGDTLYFAGEATDAEYEGSVAGALGSGERAATQILERISAARAA